MLTKIEVNMQTGEQSVVELTPEEIEIAMAQTAAWDAEQSTVIKQPTIEDLMARIAALEAK
jgi:hypothetical protein